MLNLSTPTSLIQIVNGNAVDAITIQASWSDLSPNTLPIASPQAAVGGGKNTTIATSAPTTVVPSPPANTDRNVKSLIITNTSSTSCTLAIQHFDGTTVVPIWIPGVGGAGFIFPAGWVLEYNTDGDGWILYDQSGKIQVSGPNVFVGGVAIQAGTQTATSGTAIFSNSNNVSFGLSGSSILTALANINLSAGTTSGNLSAVTFANSNNVVFGFDGTNVTASAADLGAIAAGTQTATGGTVLFSNSNGVSFGLDGSVLTASASVPVNFSAGTTSANLSAVTFGNANGVSFGLNQGTITATVANSVATISCFSKADFATNFSAAQATLSLQKASLPAALAATQLAIIADFKGFTNSSGAVTVSHAVYSFNASTASLASSGSRVFSWVSGSATSASSQFGGVSGTRYRTIGVNYSMTPGDYLFGWLFSVANGVTVNIFGRPGVNIVGTFDGVDTSAPLNGISISSVVALPSSINLTDTGYVRTGVFALQQPGVILFGTGL